MFHVYGKLDKCEPKNLLDLLCEVPTLAEANAFAFDYALSADHDLLFLTSSSREIWLCWELNRGVAPGECPWELLSEGPTS